MTEAHATNVLARQIPAFDGIRGLAIVWVVLHNATDARIAPGGGIFHLLAQLAHPGWIGVQLFFALSGFLITTGLLDTQGTPHYFRNFYARRALRILPLYYGVLFGVLVVLPRIPSMHAAVNTEGQAALWLFAVNWSRSTPDGFVHFWSLAIEEQFYLFWPLVVWQLAPRRLLSVCLSIALGALVLRCVLVIWSADWWTLYSNTLCRMDALALGSAGACLLRLPYMRERTQTRTKEMLGLALVLFLVAIPATHIYDRHRWAGETFGYTILAVSSAMFVTAVALARGSPRAPLSAMLAWPPLRSVGKYSYAMYVFHGLLHKLIGEPWLTARFGEQLPAPSILVYALVLLLVSYLLGYCSYHLYEKHFLDLKRRFVDNASSVGA
jgi:peptidoglycan/LPS O-acetylase OafA/YrhL